MGWPPSAEDCGGVKRRGFIASPDCLSAEGLVVADRGEEAGEDAPLLEVVGEVELGDLADAVAHLDTDAADEAVVVFAAERRHRHLAPAPGDGRLAAQERRSDLDATGTGGLVRN